MAKRIKGRMQKRLLEYQALQREFSLQNERYQRMRDATEAPSSPSFSGMPHAAPVGDKIGRSLSILDELRNTLADLMCEESAERSYLEEFVQRLHDPNERAVIRMRYFDGESWEWIITTLHQYNDDFIEAYDRYQRNVYRLHALALCHMDAMLEPVKTKNSLG